MKEKIEVMSEMDVYRRNEQKIYESVEETLGVDFDGIYAFFSKILEGEFDYIVLMSRRCQVLHQLFRIIFEYDNKFVNTKAVILSDKALPFYWDKIEVGDRIAVLDDIIVHGRTISEIYDIVNNSNKNVEIKLFSYEADQDMDCISQEAQKNLTVFYTAGTNEWRKLSGKIVDCIQVSNVPYTSFVTSFFQYKVPTILNAIKNIPDLQITKVEDAVQVGQKQHSYFIQEQNWKKPDIFSSLSLGECIRIYWNEITEKLTVIPYVFIRTLSEENASEVYKSVEKALPEEFKNTKNILRKEYSSKDLEKSLKEYKMRILTCILSNYYWDDFRYRYQLPKPEYVDIDTLKEGYGETVGEELCAIKKDNIDSLLQLSFPYKQEFLENFSETESILEEVVSAQKNGWMKRFFFKAWLNDEKRAEQRKGRAQGVTVDYFLKVAERLDEKRNEVLAWLINSWDVGTVTANFSVDRMRNIIGCCNTPGEQSYKIILENNPIVMRSLITVSNMITKEMAKRANKAYEEYREQLLLELLDQFRTKEQLDDYAEIEQIVRMSRGYMNAWDQPQVLNYVAQNYMDVNVIKEDFIKEKF